MGTNSLTGFGPLHAFRWTPQTGSVRLIPVGTPSVVESNARTVSGDGQVSAGSFSLGNGQSRIFRYSVSGGFEDLGNVPSSNSGSALFSTFDGQSLLCASNNNFFMWRAGEGYIPLLTLFQQSGVSIPAGYTGLTVLEMSADGNTFAGRISTGAGGIRSFIVTLSSQSCSVDFNADGDSGTDGDIEAFFACLGGNCCPACGSADFNHDGEVGTDADIESFFRVLAGGAC
ncbi:MAG: hypothetical protein H7210_04025 [Pyrinomonadaceae bacterium]|nr:hypothetical protein [Phycisphaerales bacterium]